MDKQVRNSSFQRKYRPQIFSGMHGLNYLTTEFESAIRQRRCDSIIFSGKNGHGKSTMAEIFLLRIFCENAEGLDACLKCGNCRFIIEDEGVPHVFRISGDQYTTEQFRYIENRCLYSANILPMKVNFIDDLDLAEENVLIKTIGLLNRYPDNLMLFTATNLAKIPPPVRQRCKNFPLNKVDYQPLEEFILDVCAKERILVKEKNAISLLITLAHQTPRLILTALELIKGESNELSVASLNSPVIVSNLQQLTGRFT